MYELMYVDADTPIYRAAKSVELDYINVTQKDTGKVVRFKNKTSWYGHWKNKSGGVLAKINAKREEEGLPRYSPDDFEIEECVELSPEITNHIEYAVEQFDRFVGHIKRTEFAEDYRLGVGGEGNFRMDIAQQLPYKGERKDKPLLFAEVRDAICQKYQNKVFRSTNEEIDDVMAQRGFENYLHFRKTGEWKWVLGYVDKDLKQVISPYFNYTDTKPEITIPSEFDAAKHFVQQCLSGDLGTDNIPGLPNFSKDTKEKYKLGNARGIGDATALKYLEGCETIKELFERLVEAYRDYYGDEPKEFTTWRGEKVMWNWLDYLQDNAQLLWLRRTEGEMYKIKDTLDRLGICYE